MTQQQPASPIAGTTDDRGRHGVDAEINPANIGMPISSIMEKNFLAVHAEDTVAKVEEVLSSHDFSSIAVIGSNAAVIGMISSDELVRFHAEKKNANAGRAWEICRITNFEVGPDASVLDVARLMADHRLQHIAVTSNGALLGVVSAIDFVEQVVIRQVS